MDVKLPKRKWVVAARVDESASRVARRAFSRRLKVVRHYLPLAAKRPEEDVEYVHHLRVATRRTLAAMQVFEPLLPRRRAEKLVKELKRLRRAAGDARDLDVLAERLRQFAASAEGDAWLSSVLRDVACWRREAQESIVAAQARWKRGRLTAKTCQLVHRAKWRGDDPPPPFATLASQALRPLVDDFFAVAGGDLTQITTLHEMRIRAKKLRYGMELLGGAFDPSLAEELYPHFAELQEKLGTINDLAQTSDVVGRWTDMDCQRGFGGKFEMFLAKADQQCESTKQEFRNWWTAERCENLRQQFERLLGVPPRLVPCPNGEAPVRRVDKLHEDDAAGNSEISSRTHLTRPARSCVAHQSV